MYDLQSTECRRMSTECRRMSYRMCNLDKADWGAKLQIVANLQGIMGKLFRNIKLRGKLHMCAKFQADRTTRSHLNFDFKAKK